MPKPFKLISSELKYENPWLSLREDKVIRPNWDEGIFGVVKMLPWSSVVALDKDGDIYLSKEFKYGTNEISIEIFSGALDDDEEAIDAAKRELEEELWMTASVWTPLGYINPFTTVVDSPNHIFLAQWLTKTQQNLDPGEEIEIIKLPLIDAYNMVMNSEITHGASCIAILKTFFHLEKHKK